MMCHEHKSSSKTNLYKLWQGNALEKKSAFQTDRNNKTSPRLGTNESGGAENKPYTQEKQNQDDSPCRHRQGVIYEVSRGESRHEPEHIDGAPLTKGRD